MERCTKFLFPIIFVISVFFHPSSAAVVPKCPDVKPVENFNLTAFTGIWHELARYPIQTEGLRFTSYDVKSKEGEWIAEELEDPLHPNPQRMVCRMQQDSGTKGVLLQNMSYGRLTRATFAASCGFLAHFVIYTIKISNGPRLKVSHGDNRRHAVPYLIDNYKAPPTATLQFKEYILSVAYNKYFISFVCIYDEETKTFNEYSSIAVRSKNPSADVITAINEFIKTSDILQAEKYEWNSAILK